MTLYLLASNTAIDSLESHFILNNGCMSKKNLLPQIKARMDDETDIRQSKPERQNRFNMEIMEAAATS